jgi:hypothetical protein
MKHLCLILAILIPTLGFGQIIGDSVIIYVDHRVEIKVAVPDYIDLKSSNDATTVLKVFQSMLPGIENQLASGSADLVKYSGGSSLTVEPGDPKVFYLIKDGELSNTGFRDRAIISGEGFTIFITTSDLSKIVDLSLANCLEKAIVILPGKRNWSSSLSYECTNGNVKELEVRFNDLDQIELTAGAGAGLVKSTWVADLSFRIAIGFNRKGVLRSPYISSNLVFDFDTESNINVNTFLNLGYQWNIDKYAEKPRLLGVELGYLISKHGNLFGENTFKMSFNWSPVKGVYVSPQLYITDNFKTMYPGIRIGFGL